MTPRQADKFIKQGVPVLVRDKYGYVGFLRFVARDRRSVETDGAENSDGHKGLYSRDDLEVVQEG